MVSMPPLVTFGMKSYKLHFVRRVTQILTLGMNKMAAVFDVVRLIEDVPVEGLKSGMVGTIVSVYTLPVEGYEVEFCDADGRTVAQLALFSAQFQLLK